MSIVQYFGPVMKIESTAFTAADIATFMQELLEHERLMLAERLERASDRLARLAPQVQAGYGIEAPGARRAHSSWTAHEVLAHIAVLSKFYGVLVHQISSGKVTELDLLSNVNLRDVMGERLAELDPAELMRMALADQARTVKLLRGTDALALRRRARLEDGSTISAEDMARLPLLNHLELHIGQLERALGA
jgi:hypothetical protein